MLQQAATPLNRNIEVGDFILCIWVDDDEDEDNRYDNEYLGLKVVEIKKDYIFTQRVYIGLCGLDSCDDLDWEDESLDYIQNRSCFITAEAFMAAHDYIRNFCRQLLDDIKSHAKITEQIKTRQQFKNMEQQDKNIGTLLGEIGRAFRSNIEDHIKDYILQKGDDVEWILDPLDAISHSVDIVIDAFQYGSRWDSFYGLYFHNKNAAKTYVAYDKPIERPRLTKSVGNTINFSISGEIEKVPDPNKYDKTMIIKDPQESYVANYIPSIWKDLTVPFTEKGIWQAVLLNETKSLFPKGWHGNYLNNKYVFSKEDMQLIASSCKKRINHYINKERLIAFKMSMGDPDPLKYDFTESDYEKLAFYLDREDIMPSVEIDGNKAVASFYFWNDWSGFCRKIIPIERKDQSVIIGETEHEVLVEYDCGICF